MLDIFKTTPYICAMVINGQNELVLNHKSPERIRLAEQVKALKDTFTKPMRMAFALKHDYSATHIDRFFSGTAIPPIHVAKNLLEFHKTNATK
jgi:hypothetical protein